MRILHSHMDHGMVSTRVSVLPMNKGSPENGNSGPRILTLTPCQSIED
jgi:hypothetical protein